MWNHESIWAAIDALAAKKGLSASGLAKKAGLDPTAFNPSKRHGADGPLLVVGAGAQGAAHVDAFMQVLGLRHVRVASRTRASAEALAAHARASGADAAVVDDVDAAMRDCPLVVIARRWTGWIRRKA